MGEKFEGAGICGENWWSIDSTRRVFPPPIITSSSSSSSSSSPSSNDFMDLKASCGVSDDRSNYYQVGLLGFPGDKQMMMGFGLSSSSNWEHPALFGGCNEGAAERINILEEERSNYMLKPIMNNNQELFDIPQAQAQAVLINNRSNLVKQQQPGLHFSNNTPFWNAPAAHITPPPPPPASTSIFHQHQPNSPTILFNNLIMGEKEPLESAEKSVCEAPPFKRPRIETPPPLPTFKVRKEKLGDRVTALQQLVSPFGKTDTASVFHEAIQYINFLHHQLTVLSTPYMKSGAPRQQGCDDDGKESEGAKEDLRRRGLCLVPISSTLIPETTGDIWTPTLSFRDMNELPNRLCQ